MDKFDAKDFQKTSGGFFGKLFKKGEKIVEKLFGKYQTMGREIDKVYVEISKYQHEMVNSTKMLEQMYEQNYQYYLTLEKYVVAGEMKVEELKNNQLPQLESRAAAGINLLRCSLDTLKNAIELLEQRIYDLRNGENGFLADSTANSFAAARKHKANWKNQFCFCDNHSDF